MPSTRSPATTAPYEYEVGRVFPPGNVGGAGCMPNTDKSFPTVRYRHFDFTNNDKRDASALDDYSQLIIIQEKPAKRKAGERVPAAIALVSLQYNHSRGSDRCHRTNRTPDQQSSPHSSSRTVDFEQLLVCQSKRRCALPAGLNKLLTRTIPTGVSVISHREASAASRDSSLITILSWTWNDYTASLPLTHGRLPLTRTGHRIPAAVRMLAETSTVVTLPVSTASSSERRSEDTLRPEFKAVFAPKRPQTIETHGQTRPPSPRVSGILRDESVSIVHNGNRSEAPRQILINGIPLAGIMFLDLANSGDFAANVFNEIPVPTFAAVLMAIGATFALVMSVVAFTDARRSWKAIQMLRKEQQELHAIAASSSIQEKDANPNLESFLHLNRRDIGTEFFERFGMEVFMGGAAFLISIGTYMAIGGADPRVFYASNLLSGYIGNTPAAFYGMINCAWSVMISYRARKQRLAARNLEGTTYARKALTRRAKLIQMHSTFSGISCLVSGALGMVTPTQWEPYPALLVLGILFMYTVHLFRSRISYCRLPLTLHSADISTADLVHEIDELLALRDQILSRKQQENTRSCCFPKRQETTQIRTYSRQDLEERLRIVSLCESFEQFCVEFLNDQHDYVQSNRLCQMIVLIRRRQITTLTPTDIIRFADEVDASTGDRPDVAAYELPIFEILGRRCERLLRRKTVERRISMRSRFLLELLGSHLISFPDDRNVFEKLV